LGGILPFTEKTFLGLQGYWDIGPDSSSEPASSGSFYYYLQRNDIVGKQCNSAGEVAFALTLTAVILSFVVAWTTVSRLFTNTSFSKFLAVSGAFFSAAVSVTAFSNWHVQCFLAFKDQSNGSFIPSSSITAYEYYGFNVVVVGWVFSMVTFILHIATPTGSSAGPTTPDGSNQKF
jgi:hypothetical protein